MRDVERIAIMIGHPLATSRPAGGMAATVAAEEAAADAAIVAADRQAEAEAAVQRLLAPFIAEQTRLAEEVGRERARREHAEETLAELRRRAEAAEEERDELRLRLAEATVPPVVVVGVDLENVS